MHPSTNERPDEIADHSGANPTTIACANGCVRRAHHLAHVRPYLHADVTTYRSHHASTHQSANAT
jgi:hypothetical protein